MNTGRILCKFPIPGEYITAGREYTFWQHEDSIEYKRADGAGSWMRKAILEANIREGCIEILQG